MQNNKIKESNKKFFDLWANLYDYSIPVKPWLYYIQKKVINQLKLNNQLKILDVGCGTGDSLRILSKLTNSKLYGVDISENMLKIAQKKLKDKAVLRLGGVENLPFKNETFDYVISTEAFHHFPDPQKAVNEMARVLKKNGSLVISDINFHLKFIHWLFKKIEPGHVKIYNRNDFKILFEKAGLKIMRQELIGLFAILNIGKK